MTRDDEKTLPWRDFLYTLDVVTNSAVADLEAGTGNWVKGFDVILLAAASEGGLKLPESEVLAEGSELGITMLSEGPEMKLNLQLQGFAALDTYGGRAARLVSENGAIDYRLRFSDGGAATCMLSDAPKVREGLGRFAVFFLENGDAASEQRPS